MDYKTYSSRFNQRFYTATAVCGDSYARLVAFNPKVVESMFENLFLLLHGRSMSNDLTSETNLFTNSTKPISNAKAKFSNDSKEKRLKKDWKTTVFSLIILERF